MTLRDESAEALQDCIREMMSVDASDIEEEELSRLVFGPAPEARSPRGGAPGSWHKWQDPVIEGLIPSGSRILDLGCGDGELLATLLARGDLRGQGVELDEHQVLECIKKGVPVFHGDLDEGLRGFPDRSFDVVILEETLHTLRKPGTVLGEMLRVGRTGIVSFPNFAHWRVRRSFAGYGRMPITPSLPHQWYDTPNIHLCSVRDFLDWTRRAGARVVDARVLCEGSVRRLRKKDNLYAEEALFVIIGGACCCDE